MIHLNINNIEVSVLPNTSVLKACEIAGFDIPRFCYHKRLSVAGNCRMCLVEVEKSPKPVVACAMPVMHGMVIFTETPLVKKARENVLEFLLENHPLDCPICDQGGECDLQDQAMAFGSDKSRFYDLKRGVLDKNFGPLVKTIMTRCIHCTRCVRFGEEIAGVEDLGTTIRGTHTEIGTYLEKVFKTELSGNVIDLCPVGALTSKPYAFTARPWELKTDFMLDISDALGQKVNVELKDNKIVRISPFYLVKEETLKEMVESTHHFRDFWISDKTRFSYEGLPSQFTNYISLKIKNKKLFYNSFEALKIKLESLDYKDQRMPYNEQSFVTTLVCGYNTDMETLQSAKYLADCLNKKDMVTKCSVTMARNFYLKNLSEEKLSRFKTNVSIDDLENVDLCLLIGVNPRYESSLYNLHLRKRYKQGGLKVASIGAPLDLTYPVIHLGSNLEIFSDIISNNHFFSSELRAAKCPMILVGSSLLEDQKYFQIEALIYKMLNDIPKLRYNVLQKQANQLGGLALGIPSLTPLCTNTEHTSVLYFVNVDPKEIRNILGRVFYSAKSNRVELRLPTVIIQGSRFNFDSFVTDIADYIVPSKSYIEKEKSSFLNTEGLLQTSRGIVSTSAGLNILPDSDILAKMSSLLVAKPINGADNIYSDLALYFSSLNKLGFLFKEELVVQSEKCFWFSGVRLTYKKKISMARLLDHNTVFNNPLEKKRHLWVSSIEDFYLTDGISLASPIMGKCSISNRSKSTSFDF